MASEGPRAAPAFRDGDRRRRFVDVLRGLAVTIMVVNHTARWWLDPSVGAGREALTYASMVFAGPTFLFVVGFSLALSRAAADAAGHPVGRLAARHLRRAAVIVVAGLVLNALAFPDEPVATARVLFSIGLAIVVALPLLWVLPRPAARLALVVAAAVVFAAFGRALPHLAAWSTAHPTAARLLLLEFPLFPWLGLVFLGLAIGWSDATRNRSRRSRFYAAIGATGAVLLGAFVVHEVVSRRPLLDPARDFVLNGYWTAGRATAVGIAGLILCVVALAYGVVERGRWRLAALTTLGRTALMIYVVHLVIVLRVAQRGLGLVVRDWAIYAILTLGLLVLLVGLASAWRRFGAARARWFRQPSPDRHEAGLGPHEPTTVARPDDIRRAG